jgi:uncharacterized repeat protein (TIGR01451 family)
MTSRDDSPRPRRAKTGLSVAILLLLLGLVTVPSTSAGSQFSFSLNSNLAVVRPGDTPVITIQFENGGPDPAPLVWVNLTLPEQIQYVSDDSGKPPVGTYSWALEDVQLGTVAIHVTTRVRADVADRELLEVQASLAFVDAGSGLLTSYTRDMVLSVTRPVIEVQLDQDVDSVRAGESIVHTITFANAGSDPAKDVWIQVTLPNELATVVDTAGDEGGTGIGTDSWKFSSVMPGPHSFAIQSVLAPGTPDATPLSVGVYLEYTSKAGTSLQASSAAVTAAASSPALTLVKSVDRQTAQPGESLTYTLAFSNAGSDSAPMVWLNDSLPQGTEFLSSDPEPSFLTASEIGWAFDNVAPGTYKVTARMVVSESLEDGDVLLNTAALAYVDRTGYPMNPLAADADTLVNEGPAITVSVSADLDTVRRGDQIVFTVKYDNLGSESAGTVWINNTIPDWGTYISAGPLEPDAINGRELKWRLADVPVGVHRLYIKVRILPDAPDGAFITNMVSLVYTDSFGELMNPSFAGAVRVVYVPKPLVQLDLRAAARTPPGSLASLKLSVANVGEGVARELWLNLTLPEGVSVISDTAPRAGGERWATGRYHFADLSPGTTVFEVLMEVQRETALGTRLVIEASAVYTDVDGGTYEADPASRTVLVAPRDEIPLAVVAVGTAALIAALGAIVSGREGAKYGLLMLFIPLYTKLKREHILDHETRGMIRGYVVANPGDHFNAIKEGLGLTNGTLAYHLRVLERERIVRSKKDGKFRRFYPYEMRVSENGEPTEMQQTILAIIDETPGINQKDIAGFLGVTQPTVNYHIERLKEMGHVRVVRKGVRVLYFRRRHGPR